MNTLLWGALATALLFVTAYLKLWLWVYIPRNPWSPALETDIHLLMRMPKSLWWLYEHNLAWRRNVAIRWSYWRSGQKVTAPPLSEAEVDKLQQIMGRQFDPRMRQQLTDRKI